MCYKLLTILSLIAAWAVARDNKISKTLGLRWKFHGNATHKPVIPEGGIFPYRGQDFPLSAINIGDNGLVIIPASANIIARNDTVTTNTSTTSNVSSTSATSTTTVSPQPLPVSHPKCGLVNTRIVNGVLTVRNEYPWLVWTVLKWSDSHQRRCAGSIINEQWILTAAHCPYRTNSALTALYYPESISVFVGAYNKDKPGATGGYSVAVDVKNIYMYPELHLPYDIALYKLKRPLVFTQRVAPVCLPPRAWENEEFVNKTVIPSGWGKTESGSLSTYSREYETVGYSIENCALVYGNWMRPTQMCTDGSARKHTCSGDSGGPVMRIEEGRAFQVGVISFGSGNCKDTLPDGHVRVAAFIDWIESVTNVTLNI